MASVNFFHYQIQPSCTEAEFGLTDPGNSQPAQITFDLDKCGATVDNPNCKEITFIPVDHNIPLKDGNGNDLSTCDGLLRYTRDNELLAFVELKDRGKQWLEEAIAQLGSTIELFKQNHVYTDFKIRRAYAANTQHPHFHSSHSELMQRFHKDNDFILRISTCIHV